MTILLPSDNYIWWNTFVAHSFWIWLMIFACFINLILYFWRRKTIIAFNLDWMNSFAFKLSLL